MPDQIANSQAGYFYSKGRRALRNRSEADLNRALEHFQSALESDPDFALAYSGLADTYTLMYIYHLLPLEESLEKAKTAVQQAWKLDDSLAEVHTSVGHIRKVFDGDLSEAEKAYRRAISIDPDYATAHHWYSALLSSRGQFDEALKEVQQALRTDPESTALQTGAAFLQAKLGHWDEAVSAFEKAISIDPQNEMIRINYALLLTQMGQKEKSMDQAEKALLIAPRSSFVKGVYGSVLYYSREYNRAVDILTQALGETTTSNPMGRLILGQCYLQRGMYQQALDEFRKTPGSSGTYTAETDLAVVATSLRGITFARMGETEQARKVLSDLMPSSDEKAPEPFWLGLLCVALGQQDQGFQLLEQALESGDMWLRYAKVHPLFDDVRSAGLYRALLERMGLEKEP
ncbi:MAG: tetratricopeptide repeat protein [Bradymonadales bacterium]|nr:tetratricopeptide repeat protein [Bradymonadales bacterium]